MGAFVVGIGSSGPRAEDAIHEGLERLGKHPQLTIVGTSRLYENPAVGGATRARFVNAAVVVETALGPQALLRALHAIESAGGRVRTVPNAARALDLDILVGLDILAPTSSPALPHPRLAGRAFAVIPALEALAAAKRTAPAFLVEAGRALGGMDTPTLTPIVDPRARD